jgi:hypothetical protein
MGSEWVECVGREWRQRLAEGTTTSVLCKAGVGGPTFNLNMSALSWATSRECDSEAAPPSLDLASCRDCESRDDVRESYSVCKDCWGDEGTGRTQTQVQPFGKLQHKSCVGWSGPPHTQPDLTLAAASHSAPRLHPISTHQRALQVTVIGPESSRLLLNYEQGALRTSQRGMEKRGPRRGCQVNIRMGC